LTYQVAGRTIPITLAELLGEPNALLVWDMQRATVSRAFGADAVLAVQARLLDSARRCGVPVVYAQHESLPIARQDRPALRRQLRAVGGNVDALPSLLGNQMVPGTPGWEIVSELAPTAADVVLRKNASSAFNGTGLLDLLRSWRLDVLVIVGIATDRGVAETSRDAVSHGIFPVIVSDGVTAYDREQHQHALEELSRIGDVCDSATVINAWVSGPASV
jgi:nicotinamidase-related amidase